jgi:hypothetical protein
MTESSVPPSSGAEAAAEIDWKVFDPYPENTLYCRCGSVYRSHSKFVIRPAPGLLARKSCPKCGKHDDLRRASSDPEAMTIGHERER